jgi:hypothetical protein
MWKLGKFCMRRSGGCKASSVAEQIIVSAYGHAEEYNCECEEGYSYEDYCAETADL